MAFFYNFKRMMRNEMKRGRFMITLTVAAFLLCALSILVYLIGGLGAYYTAVWIMTTGIVLMLPGFFEIFRERKIRKAKKAKVRLKTAPKAATNSQMGFHDIDETPRQIQPTDEELLTVAPPTTPQSAPKTPAQPAATPPETPNRPLKPWEVRRSGGY
jgi:hypothetical protein